MNILEQDSKVENKLKFIEDFRDRHKGEEIWILGTGPTLDDLPNDFFNTPKNRTSIACNYTIMAFPQCTYWHTTHSRQVIFMREHKPRILKKAILLLPLLKKRPPLNDEQSLKLLGSYWNDPIYFRGRGEKNFEILVNRTVKYIMNRQVCPWHYLGNATLIHYAIQIAAIFGAKKISLVGCETTLRAGKYHAEKLRKYYSPTGKDVVKPEVFRCMYAKGTQLLARAFKPYGIEVRRYFPKESYKNIA